MTVEPMTDADLAEVREQHAKWGLSSNPTTNVMVDRLFARLDAERTRADAAEAERDAAVARERERCAQIVCDRIMAARLGEIDQDLRSIRHIIEHAIRHPTPTAAQED